MSLKGSLQGDVFAGLVRTGRRFLQDGVRGNHFTGNQILADAEVLKGTLGLEHTIACRRGT